MVLTDLLPLLLLLLAAARFELRYLLLGFIIFLVMMTGLVKVV